MTRERFELEILRLQVEHLQALQALQLREQEARTLKAESELRVQRLVEQHAEKLSGTLDLLKVRMGSS